MDFSYTAGYDISCQKPAADSLGLQIGHSYLGDYVILNQSNW